MNQVMPAFTGVPDKLPSGFNVSPLGNAPAEALQLKGAEPPLAVNTKPT
jgi:hypothetical protein